MEASFLGIMSVTGITLVFSLLQADEARLEIISIRSRLPR